LNKKNKDKTWDGRRWKRKGQTGREVKKIKEKFRGLRFFWKSGIKAKKLCIERKARGHIQGDLRQGDKIAACKG